MNKNKLKRNRPDFDGKDRGIYAHNKAILRKTAQICALCGMPIDKSLRYPNPMSISIDHIIPVALGGASTLDNLQATHLVCNKAKGKKMCSSNNRKESFNVQNRPEATTGRLPQVIDWTSYEG